MRHIWVHDIINGLTTARGFGELLSAKHPEVTAQVQTLNEDLMRLQRAFVDAVMPVLRQKAPNWRAISLPCDIVRAITLAKGYADEFAEQHPRYAEAVQTFIDEVDRATRCLTAAVIPPDRSEPGHKQSGAEP